MKTVHEIVGCWLLLLIAVCVCVMIWTAFDIHNRMPINQLMLGGMLLFGYLPWKCTKPSARRATGQKGKA
jgi:CDP-diglyceride synthetase